jgi:AraC-like DNA-binding protein
MFLALFFIIISIYEMTHSFLVLEKSVFWVAVFYNHITPLTLLLGPLLYWYTRNTLQRSQGLKKLDYFHFIPALIQFISIFPYCIKSFAYKLEFSAKIIENIDNVRLVSTNIFFTTFENFCIRFGLFLIYILFSLSYLGKYCFVVSKTKNDNISSRKTIKWLLILNISPLIIVFNSLILTYNCVINQPSIGLIKSQTVLLISEVFFFILTFSLLLFPNILYGITPILAKPKRREMELTSTTKEKKNENTLKEEENIKEIGEKISLYLSKKRPYLNPNFSISEISLILKIPINKISQSLLTHYGKKFSDIRKELRVEHAMTLLENNTSELITMDAIGQKSGFTTRSNFYTAFKSITNTTPSEYLKNLKSKMGIENNT